MSTTTTADLSAVSRVTYLKRRKRPMPSVSKKQEKFMAAVAHNPKFAEKVGVSQRVGKDFRAADQKKKQRRRGGISEAIEQHMKGRGARKQNGYGHSLDPHPEDPDDGY